MKELKYNLKCLLQKKELYLSIIGILLINLVHIFLVIHYNSSPYMFYENGFKAEYLFILYNINVSFSSIIIIVIPILSSTVFSDINFIEKKQKINNLLYTRLSEKKLIITRFILILITIFFINFLSFLMNYFSLYFIYGSGNAISYFQSPAFYMMTRKDVFIDSLRLSNITLFVVFITAHVSLIISLLSGFSFSISFFVKQKLIIYIMPFLIVIITELIFPFLNLYSYSIVGQLQPLSTFNIFNAIVIYIILTVISFILMKKYCIKKDVL